MPNPLWPIRVRIAASAQGFILGAIFGIILGAVLGGSQMVIGR
jgi:uncharacterized membrane protein YoaK (UPF0700 family)